MKKFIFLFSVLVLFFSCMTPEEVEEYRKKHYERDRDELQGECSLFDITFNGETHQYVKWVHPYGNATTGSVSHWAGCKYCKEKSYHENNQDDWLYNY